MLDDILAHFSFNPANTLPFGLIYNIFTRIWSAINLEKKKKSTKKCKFLLIFFEWIFKMSLSIRHVQKIYFLCKMKKIFREILFYEISSSCIIVISPSCVLLMIMIWFPSFILMWWCNLCIILTNLSKISQNVIYSHKRAFQHFLLCHTYPAFIHIHTIIIFSNFE